MRESWSAQLESRTSRPLEDHMFDRLKTRVVSCASSACRVSQCVCVCVCASVTYLQQSLSIGRMQHACCCSRLVCLRCLREQQVRSSFRPSHTHTRIGATRSVLARAVRAAASNSRDKSTQQGVHSASAPAGTHHRFQVHSRCCSLRLHAPHIADAVPLRSVGHSPFVALPCLASVSRATDRSARLLHFASRAAARRTRQD